MASINDQTQSNNAEDEDAELMKIVAARANHDSAIAESVAAPATTEAQPAASRRLDFFSKTDPAKQDVNVSISHIRVKTEELTMDTLPPPSCDMARARVDDDSTMMSTMVSTTEGEIPTVMALSDPNDGPIATTKYELISGLWVRLSEDAEVNLKDDGHLSVRAKAASLGDSFWTANGVCLQAKIVGNEVQNLVVSIDTLALDPLVTRDQVIEFLGRFGVPPEDEQPKENQASTESEPARAGRMTREEWEQFLLNARNDVRHPVQSEVDDATLVTLDKILTADESGVFKKLDLKIPEAQVHAITCELLPQKTTIDFPDCQGSDGATVRTLVEYYARSVLNKMDLLSGRKADVSMNAVAADVASVKVSMIGATVGSVLLGPAGFVAGSYFGNRLIRRSSNTIVGAAAGVALFGPVGLVAGAAAASDGPVGPSRPQPNTKAWIDDSGKSTRRSVVQAASDHVATNKYEYAGSTGVMAGATVGMLVAGPIGLVAGSVAGSLSSRKIVESTTASTERKGGDEKNGTTAEEKPYKFGDFTRGIVARGKQSRTTNENEGYRFGDFTRGLFS